MLNTGRSWWRLMLAAGLMLVADVGPVGCVLSGGCTEVGCSDGFFVSVTSADGTVPSGTHVLSVVADGTPVTCTMEVPVAPRAEGPLTAAFCAGLTMGVNPATMCTETVTDRTHSLTCMPIPGQFIENFTLMGKPKQVHVTLTVDGAVVLDRTETPTYQPTQPNGPKCEPTCQEASATWMFSAS